MPATFRITSTFTIRRSAASWFLAALGDVTEATLRPGMLMSVPLGAAGITSLPIKEVAPTCGEHPQFVIHLESDNPQIVAAWKQLQLVGHVIEVHDPSETPTRPSSPNAI